jgi:hypothetical protein
MAQATPAEIVTKVLRIVTRDDWRADPSAIKELEAYLFSDASGPQYEFFGIPSATMIGEETVGAADTRELIVVTDSLPYRAIVAPDPSGKWKLREFLTQCTGCLGTREILGRPCDSCSGTGWGLRPS